MIGHEHAFTLLLFAIVHAVGLVEHAYGGAHSQHILMHLVARIDQLGAYERANVRFAPQKYNPLNLVVTLQLFEFYREFGAGFSLRVLVEIFCVPTESPKIVFRYFR